MTEQENTTLVAVINKVKTIASNKFDGRVYDNVLAIFNMLTTREKRILLKGLINICFIVEDKIVVDSGLLMGIKHEMHVDAKETVESIDDVDAYNKLELIKLKSWVVKTVIKTALALTAGYVLITAVTGGGGDILGSISNIFKILKVVISG